MKTLRLVLLVVISLLVTPFTSASSVELRPGDVLIFKLPGEASFEQPFQLDRRGRVLLPEIGALSLEGLDLAEARLLAQERLAEVYKDLSGFDLILKERRLSVMVLGFVKQPGPVDLPSSSNVQMAINEAGGLAQGAQLDKLQIRRQDKMIEFDYKRYLDSGDSGILPQLQPMDVIFIPASPLIGNVQVEFDARTLTAAGDAGGDGEAVTVFGEVHRPGTFAYKSDSDVIDMLMRAGGVTRYGGVEQIRVISNGKPYPFNMREYLDTGDRNLMPPIKDGDIVFVPQATDDIKTGARTVYVMGEVFKPGAFDTKADASFLDILATAGGPTRFAETRHIRIIRANGKIKPFDLQGHMDGTNPHPIPTIRAGDAILIPEKTDMNEKSWLKIPTSRAIRVMGAVRRPGRYEWSDEMNLMDLLAHAGGPAPTADTAHIRIMRVMPGGDTRTSKFNLKHFIDFGGDINKIPYVRAGDSVFIPELPRDPNDNRSQWVRQSSERSIYIFGQVGAPGRYAFNDEMNFLDILSAAQGPTARADLSAVRITHRKEEEVRVTRLNLHLYFETGDESLLPQVKNEDVIFLPERGREWLQKPKETVVRVLGAVGRPGRYSFDDSMTVLDLLAEAGGPRDTALQDRIVVVNRVDGEAHARVFDLVEFAKTGDFSELPLVRAGDTVYVPSREQSSWYRFVSTLRESITVFSFARLVGF